MPITDHVHCFISCSVSGVECHGLAVAGRCLEWNILQMNSVLALEVA
jgi:hypothetical protein